MLPSSQLTLRNGAAGASGMHQSGGNREEEYRGPRPNQKGSERQGPNIHLKATHASSSDGEVGAGEKMG